MTVSSKIFWFVFWTLFINFFGFVDVELFVIANFLIAFFFIFNFAVNNIDFSLLTTHIKLSLLNVRILSMFILNFFERFFSNFKQVCGWFLSAIGAEVLSKKVFVNDVTVVARVNVLRIMTSCIASCYYINTKSAIRLYSHLYKKTKMLLGVRWENK